MNDRATWISSGKVEMLFLCHFTIVNAVRYSEVMNQVAICYVGVWLMLAQADGRIEITHPRIQPVYVKTGDTLELICELDDPFSLQWHRAATYQSSKAGSHHYQKLDTSSQSGFYMTSHVQDGYGWTNLTKHNVSLADAGSYKCSMVSKPHMSYAVDVNVLQADEIAGVVQRTGLSAVIGCVVNSSDRIQVDFSWSKGDRRIIDDHHYTITHNQSDVTTFSQLNISRVGDNDIGPYHCNMTLANGITLHQVVNLYTYPQVRPMSRSRNLVAGKILELECRVWGWPSPNVTWQRVGTSGSNSRIPLNISDSRILSRAGSAVGPLGIAVENATLIIRDVTYDDRDLYVCDASSIIGGQSYFNNATVLVRVKGRFAPIWPLLGIIAEAIILCIIIVVHEKNRARQRAEAENKESDNHLENSLTAQGSHNTQDSLRYRK